MTKRRPMAATHEQAAVHTSLFRSPTTSCASPPGREDLQADRPAIPADVQGSRRHSGAGVNSAQFLAGFRQEVTILDRSRVEVIRGMSISTRRPRDLQIVVSVASPVGGRRSSRGRAGPSPALWMVSVNVGTSPTLTASTSAFNEANWRCDGLWSLSILLRVNHRML